MFLKRHVGTQLSLLYQIRIPLLSVCTLLFSKNEYSQYSSFHAYKFILKANGIPNLKFKGKGLTPMSLSNPADSFPPLLCTISPVQLLVQWWMQKCEECNTAHDWLHGRQRNLQKTPSWELILYHFLLLLSHECCCDSFQHFEISWYL